MTPSKKTHDLIFLRQTQVIESRKTNELYNWND